MASSSPLKSSRTVKTSMPEDPDTLIDDGPPPSSVLSSFLADGEIFDLLATRANGELHMMAIWGSHNFVVPYKGAMRALAERMVEVRPDLDMAEVLDALVVVHLAYVARGTNRGGMPYPKPIEIPPGPIAKDRL